MQLKLSQKGESVYCDIMTHDGETGTPEHSAVLLLMANAIGVLGSGVDRTVSART